MAGAAALKPVLALLVNAFVWGVSWWPFRQLQAMGLHPLWATTLIYLVSSAAIAAWRPRALRQLFTEPALWAIFVASGLTNATFNWAVSIGDVVRVVLLFYLMPLWALLLARVLLGEPLSRAALLRVAAALAGAALVLYGGGAAEPAGGGSAGGGQGPLAGRGLADALALVGGFCFALNNVMLRRQAAMPEEGRSLAMFVGGAVVAAGVALALSSSGVVPVPAPAGLVGWAWPAFALSLAFMVSNLCLQYGAARLPATITAVVMPSEVLFASLSAVWWGGATLHAEVVVGGTLIVGAALASLL